MKNLFLFLAIICLGSSNLISKVPEFHQNPQVGNYQDDTGTLQAYFDKGDVINLPAGKVFNISGTVYIRKNSQIVYGNMAVIKYSGSDAAIGFQRVNDKNYPVRVTIQDLSINVEGAGAVGIRWQASYSQLKNCGVSVAGNNDTGIQLCGDGANGTGSYYNLFENCFVQGGKQKGATGQYGWKFTYDKNAASRCPNSNTWVGGRVGQCDVGMYINGDGNVINHIASEGCGISFYFDNPDSKAGCVSNKVLYPYIESCKTAFKFGSNAIGCVASTPFVTSTPSLKEDLGTRNIFNQ
ncbi:hypothetical protein [Mucilaginibacter flavidus]|uniref:hypothetical protein n=1 Tax=Mucilaginibacter flavidus TaxID=2949309 RepID=UPI0020929FF8|nr:hypothetical protein [Mucilaginibacter flavidus]MCO5949300.1 hypothetical protein [Mucilaginibacter flavidus]